MKTIEFENMGSYLQDRRKELKFTQTELANKLKVHVQFVSNWERGLCAPPSHSFQNVISILKVNRAMLAEKMLDDSRKIIVSKIYRKTK